MRGPSHLPPSKTESQLFTGRVCTPPSSTHVQEYSLSLPGITCGRGRATAPSLLPASFAASTDGMGGERYPGCLGECCPVLSSPGFTFSPFPQKSGGAAVLLVRKLQHR